ncbi:MAG: ParB N-terminal domain-containing protein [Candidatus Caldarchaeum sp.]
MVTYIPVDKLFKSRLNPRIVADPDKLEALKLSVSEGGVKYPLLVRKTADGRYEVLDGSRRLRVADVLGIQNIPCEVVEVGDEAEAARFTLRIHVSQEELKPEEIVIAIQTAIREGYYQSEREACSDLGISYRTYLEWKRRMGKIGEGEEVLEREMEKAGITGEMRQLILASGLGREATRQILDHLAEDKKADVAELVEKYVRAKPRRGEDNSVEAEGRYLYRIRFSGRNTVFELVDNGLVVGSVAFPNEDLPIVRQLFKYVRG